MKNIFRFSALLSAAVAIALAATGCREEIDTDQYDSSEVTLASYGPNPVARGGALRFFGSNLDQVVEVNVPGIDPVTDIEVVTAGKVSEIRIKLPAEGPDVGIVTLTTRDGKTLATRSELEYTESVVFESFTAPATAFPGDVITINGDYMNLVKAVIFEGGEEVDVEEGATRHEVKAIVPATALTGKIILSDKGEIENLFYSEKDLTIGEPTVTSAGKKTVKAGDKLTVKGNHLVMIESIAFEGETVDEFETAADGKSITVSIPEKAGDGKVMFNSFAQKSYEAAEIETIAPEVSAVSPKPVKAGDKLTITGTYLDLVSKVSFEGADDATFIYENNSISVRVDSTVVEGDVTLTLANGKTVTAPFTLVHPTITEVSPLELTAGETITVKGTDLGLIAGASLGGKAIAFEKVSETEIRIITDATSVGGNVALTLNNNESITNDSEVTLHYLSLVVVSSINASQHIGQEVVITGSKLALVETIYIGDVKVTEYGLRKDDEIRFIMPEAKLGKYDVDFHLYNGDVEKQPEQIEVLAPQRIISAWSGNSTVTWSGGAVSDLSWGGWKYAGKLSAGNIIKATLTVDAENAVIRFGNGSWAGMPSTLNTLGDGDGNIPLAMGTTYCSIVLTDADIEQLDTNGGLVICGTGYTITDVSIIADIPQEVAIWTGSCKISWSASDPWASSPNALQALAYGAYDWSNVKAGTELIVRFTKVPECDYYQLRIGNGNWAALPGTKDVNEFNGETEFRVVLTEAMVTDLTTNNGMVLCGYGCDISEVALLSPDKFEGQ